MGQQHKKYILALIFGDKRALSYSLKRSLKEIGHYHLLVLSGLHFRVVVLIFQMLFQVPIFSLSSLGVSQVWLRFLMQLKMVVLLAVVWLYFSICDSTPAVFRAAIASTVYVGAPYFMFTGSMKNHLILTSFIMLVLDPLAALSLSSLVSWYCVVILFGFAGRGPSVAVLIRQMQLAMPSYIWFEGCSMIGALFGALTVPCFVLVLVALCFSFMLAAFGGLEMIFVGELADSYFALLQLLSRHLEILSVPNFQSSVHEPVFRFCMLVIAVIFFLEAVSSREPDEVNPLTAFTAKAS